MKKAIIAVAAILLLAGLPTLTISFGASEVVNKNEDQEIFEIPESSHGGFLHREPRPMG